MDFIYIHGAKHKPRENFDLQVLTASVLIYDVLKSTRTCSTTSNSEKAKTFSFGDNSDGQLGIRLEKKNENETKFNCAIRVRIPSDSKPMHIGCGDYHTALVTDGGELFTWGRGKGGQLGHDDDTNRYLPSQVEAMEGKHVRSVACGSETTACLVTRAWVPDEEVKTCMACKIKFTTVRRRHHCRKCGGVFCGSCTPKRIPILSLGYRNPVRVCEKCHVVLSDP